MPEPERGGLPNLRPEYFVRVDERDDSEFYREPRLVTHIDDTAIAALEKFHAWLLPPGGAVLDLMASWVSHLPPGLELGRLAGLGLNAIELSSNPRLTEWVVQDLNRDPNLPWPDATFDAAICTVSVQYLVRPADVFAEVGRVLKPGAPFAITYSNRCFPTKAVAAWLALGDRDRAELIALYFAHARIFGQPRAYALVAGEDSDPLYCVVAERMGNAGSAGIT